jgi:hypothetical protein
MQVDHLECITWISAYVTGNPFLITNFQSLAREFILQYICREYRVILADAQLLTGTVKFQDEDAEIITGMQFATYNKRTFR